MTDHYAQQDKMSYPFACKKPRCPVVKVIIWQEKKKMLLPTTDGEPPAPCLLDFHRACFCSERRAVRFGRCPICMIDSTHLSGLPGTCRRRRHLLAHWICSSLMRMSLCRARHQSWATVVFKFFDGGKKRQKERKKEADMWNLVCLLYADRWRKYYIVAFYSNTLKPFFFFFNPLRDLKRWIYTATSAFISS